MTGVHLYAVTGLPVVQAGDDLAELIAGALRHLQLQLRQGDVLVVAQKVVSRAEGRLVDLRLVQPSPAALKLAAQSEKDARVCELILRESRSIVRVRPGLIIARHRLGFVCANAGIDRSNASADDEAVLLLPEDPDESARRLRYDLYRKTGVAPAVIIADSHGRPFREGAVGVCIGVAGMAPVLSEVGRQDLFGYTLRTTAEAVADELASAATLIMGQANEGIPAVVVRGLFEARDAVRIMGEAEATAGHLIRPEEKDLFV